MVIHDAATPVGTSHTTISLALTTTTTTNVALVLIQGPLLFRYVVLKSKLNCSALGLVCVSISVISVLHGDTTSSCRLDDVSVNSVCSVWTGCVTSRGSNSRISRCWLDTDLCISALLLFCSEAVKQSRKIRLIDWLGFNAVFHNFSVISRRPVHLLMCFLVFSHQYNTT